MFFLCARLQHLKEMPFIISSLLFVLLRVSDSGSELEEDVEDLWSIKIWILSVRALECVPSEVT